MSKTACGYLGACAQGNGTEYMTFQVCNVGSLGIAGPVANTYCGNITPGEGCAQLFCAGGSLYIAGGIGKPGPNGEISKPTSIVTSPSKPAGLLTGPTKPAGLLTGPAKPKPSGNPYQIKRGPIEYTLPNGNTGFLQTGLRRNCHLVVYIKEKNCLGQTINFVQYVFDPQGNLIHIDPKFGRGVSPPPMVKK
jgi:hypothetical protein